MALDISSVEFRSISFSVTFLASSDELPKVSFPKLILFPSMTTSLEVVVEFSGLVVLVLAIIVSFFKLSDKVVLAILTDPILSL